MTQPSYMNSSSQKSLMENASQHLQDMLSNFKEQNYSEIIMKSRLEREERLKLIRDSRKNS